jgi:release factor glutamine methyltransferase
MEPSDSVQGSSSIMGRDARGMTWGAALAWGMETLSAAGSPSPRLDALTLLMRALRVPHAIIESSPQRPLSPAVEQRYAAWIRRRTEGEPVAYITGHKAFMGLDLLVDRRVYLVRPGTQLLVGAVLEIARLRPEEDTLLAADVGTGSGAIALALACLEPRFARIYAVDASAEALAVARRNGEHYRTADRIVWLEGDLLAPVPEPVDLIITNLPTIPAEGFTLPPAVARFEPALAFFGGADGLVLVQRLVQQARAKLRPGGTLALELQPEQAESVRGLLTEVWPAAEVRALRTGDGGERFLIAQLGPANQTAAMGREREGTAES